MHLRSSLFPLILILLPTLVAVLVLILFQDSRLAAGSFWITFFVMCLWISQLDEREG